MAEELTLPTHVNKCVVATCNLNQWALDFDGNLNRILESIDKAKRAGAKYRMGPELEISGYSCEDHFLELDTIMHSDQSLAAILKSDATEGILCDIGCPVIHNNVRYNCRVFCLNRRIVLVRPKTYLADDGNYREKRFFTSWNYSDKTLHDHTLSDILRGVTGQTTVPFGVGVIATEETMLASEMCEELWTPNSPHIHMYLSGVEIISNGSGSHHELRKLNSRLALMQNATRRCGGAYLFANHQGCDGNRLYFDGSSLIAVNGEIVAQATQFGLQDVEVITSVIDLEAIRSYRGTFASLQEQSSTAVSFPVIDIRHFSLRCNKQAAADTLRTPLSQEAPAKSMQLHTPEEECALGPACWLWDYLRRSGAAGFLLPLSGGADSASVAAIVRVMCVLVADAVVEGNQQVIADVTALFSKNEVRSVVLELARKKMISKCKGDITSAAATIGNGKLAAEQAERLTTDSSPANNGSSSSSSSSSSGNGNNGESSENGVIHTASEDEVENMPSSQQKSVLANELCYQVLHTVYMGSMNSSLNTRDRASRLADSIHAYHSNIVIDEIIAAILNVFTTLTGRTPHFQSKGGSMAQDLALQNIQARIRMVMAYLFAQLFPWLRGNAGFLLVLSSGNVDEALRGYMTKYDCSSGDLNPIGGICKGDLKRMLRWISGKYALPVLEEIATAVPTAELRPIINESGDTSESSQADEEEMGMTYEELGVFGYLRKVLKCGPVRMFLKLVDMWQQLSPTEVATKVKRFFFYYSVNRHKLTTLTPAYHAECYSPDDNRFDLRQFLYNTKWPRQFRTIDSILEAHYSNVSTTDRQLPTSTSTELAVGSPLPAPVMAAPLPTAPCAPPAPTPVAVDVSGTDAAVTAAGVDAVGVERSRTFGSTGDSSTVFAGIGCETVSLSTNPSTAGPSSPIDHH